MKIYPITNYCPNLLNFLCLILNLLNTKQVCKKYINHTKTCHKFRTPQKKYYYLT